MDVIQNPQQGDDSSLAQHPGSVGDTALPSMDMEKVYPRQVSTGLSRGIQQLGSPSIFVDSGDEQIIVAKNQVNQVLMGNQPIFGEGFYVTKLGIDAKTAKNASDFVFNSNQNVFKIIRAEIVNLAISASPISTVTIPHGLGFAPITIAFLNEVDASSLADNVNIPLPTFLSVAIDPVGFQIKFGSWIYASSDGVNVYIQCLNSGGVALGNFPIKYYLLQETASGTSS